MDHCKYTSNRIYNCDEKGLITMHNPFNTVAKLGGKMLLKGKKKEKAHCCYETNRVFRFSKLL